jgi:hypothetical protein
MDPNFSEVHQKLTVRVLIIVLQCPKQLTMKSQTLSGNVHKAKFDEFVWFLYLQFI